MNNKPESLREEYRLRFTKLESYRNQVWQVLCQNYFSRFIASEAHVLDLGSGWGEFINNVHAGKKYAMDLNPDSQRQLHESIQFLHQDCSQQWQLEAETLDIVFTSNFLEHLPDKEHVERTLSEAYRCLKPDGLIICLGPNVKYVPGAYWDFWDHFVPITELSLSEILQLKGFHTEHCIPRFLPYSMSTGSTPPLFLVQMYLKLSIAWRFFGKQFLVIARRPK